MKTVELRPQWFTLAEAITYVAFGEALDTEMLASKGFPSEQRYRRRIIDSLRKCHNEIRKDKKYTAFRELLHSHCQNPFDKNDPAANVITSSDLAAFEGFKPQSASKLQDLLADWERASAEDKAQPADAVDKIRDAGRAGKLPLQGVRYGGLSSLPEPIPAQYLRRDRTPAPSTG